MIFLTKHKMFFCRVAFFASLVFFIFTFCKYQKQLTKANSLKNETHQFMMQSTAREKNQTDQNNISNTKHDLIQTVLNSSSKSLIGSRHRIMTSALEFSGIPSEEKKFVREQFQLMMVKMSEDVAKRSILNQEESDVSTGKFVYNIAHNSIVGDALLNDFQNMLKQKYGERSCKLLMSCLNTDQFMGGFGKYDVKIKISKTTQTLCGGERKISAVIETFDPVLKRRIRGIGGDQEDLEKYYGSAFDLSQFYK